MPRILCLLLLLLGSSVRANNDPQQLLNVLPQAWAQAASAGDMDKLLGLYSPEAFIHVVFTSDELHGYDEIRAYYEKYSAQPPNVHITEVEESTILGGNVGLLSGKALVEFAGESPMRTHFSIVATWIDDHWVVQLQHTSRLDQ